MANAEEKLKNESRRETAFLAHPPLHLDALARIGRWCTAWKWWLSNFSICSRKESWAVELLVQWSLLMITWIVKGKICWWNLLLSVPMKVCLKPVPLLCLARHQSFNYQKLLFQLSCKVLVTVVSNPSSKCLLERKKQFKQTLFCLKLRFICSCWSTWPFLPFHYQKQKSQLHKMKSGLLQQELKLQQNLSRMPESEQIRSCDPACE